MQFSEDRFRQQVDSALVKIKTVLDNARTPELAEDVSHKYEDKYALAEYMTNTALASQLNALELLGLTEKYLKQVRQWGLSRPITIRFMAEESCEFDKEVTRKVDSATERVSTYSNNSGHQSTWTDKVRFRWFALHCLTVRCNIYYLFIIIITGCYDHH
jgi:hypothetical protein